MKTKRVHALQRLAVTGLVAALFASPVSSMLTGVPISKVSAAAATQQPSQSSLKPIWTKTLGDPSKINTQATLIGNELYYTTGKLYVSFDALRGSTQWTYPAAAVSPTVADGKSVFFTDSKGQLTKLNAVTGKVQWKVKTQSQPRKGELYSNQSLHAANGVIFVGDGYGLTAYNASNGKVKWKLKGGDHGYKVLQIGQVLVTGSSIDGALTTSGLKGIDAKTGKVKWTLTDGDHNEILFTNGKSFFTRNVSEGIDAGYAANIDEVSLSTGKVVATQSFLPVDFVESQSASDVKSDGKYYYVVGKFDDEQKTATVSRFPVNSKSKAEPDKTYRFNSKVVDWTIGGNNTAFIGLENGDLLLLNTDSGQTIASGKYKGVRTPTLLGKDVIAVQHGAQISGVKIAESSK